MATKTGWTIADYLALEEPDGPHHELSEGELIVTPSTTFRHNRIRDRINARLDAYLETRALGVVTSETDFQLGPATVRRPDVAFVLGSRFRPEYEEQIPIPIAPDLAIEVISTHDRPGAVRKKIQQYLDAGTQAVWLLYPQAAEARVLCAGGAAPEIRTLDQALEAPGLLPGFSIPLRAILGNN